jgi:hypothetical protein
MPPNDDIRNDHSTYNMLRNEDRALLMRHGYKPGELPPAEERELLRDLHAESDDTDDNSGVASEIGDEQDGTDADAS